MTDEIRRLRSQLLGGPTVRRVRRNRKNATRRGRFEQLERRDLLATIWRNPVDALDVVADGNTVPLDVLNIINELNDNGSRFLPDQKDPDKAYWDTSGDQFIAPLDALQVINAINAAEASPYRLSEGTTLHNQSAVTMTLGQPAGKRTYRLRVDADFDQSDQNAVADDVFAVYLVNPLDLSETLLDRGEPGTALFTLSPRGAEYQPGPVRWDGSILEIDVSALASRDTGVLKLQLLGIDADAGTRITVQPLSNEVDPAGTSVPSFPAASPPLSAGAGLNLSGLAPVTTVDALVENVRFDETIGRLTSEVRLRSESGSLGRSVAVVFPDLPAGVTLLNASGTTTDGAPYLNWQPAMPPGGLEESALSERLLVEFDDPTQIRFTLAPRILAGSNHAPTLDPIGPLTVFPGGVLQVLPVAVDQDGDPVTIAIRNVAGGSSDPATLPTGTLRADGTLIFRPAPNQLGTYTFDIVASDGALEAIRSVTLNVVADPITTTRVSGRVLQVDGQPLASMPVEIGAVQGLTAADGSFLLDLGSGSIVSDTLKVRGELFSGSLVYPFIGEKLPLILEHDIYPNVNNVVERPIFLPALDIANGKDIDPAQDTTVTTAAIPGASVLVRSGTLMNQQGTPFTGLLSITEVPRDLTPAALPPDLIPDLVVTIQPGEMVFASPAPLTFPNPSGWPAGTLMDLWSINPVTGDFDDVGDMRVSPDGTTIETISGGVRNSSWHFAAPPRPTPTAVTTNPKNQKKGCGVTGACRKTTSSVEFHSGAQLETHDLVGYQSLGIRRGVTLVYDSERADPRPIVHFGYDNTPTDPAMRLVGKLSFSRDDFAQQVPGFAGGQFGLSGGEHFWSLPGGNVDAALQGDLRAQPSGRYEYTVTSGLLRLRDQMFSGSLAEQNGELIHVNGIGSPFGNGWGLVGLQELVENSDGSVLLIDGDGSELLFAAPAVIGDPFIAPAGDFSTLAKLPDGTFRRTMTDQAVFTFNAQKRLSSLRERNGNETRYAYDAAGLLTKITDPVGLETIFSSTQGRINSITDPAGRVTQLEHDATDNLTGVTDPDGSERTWRYDRDRHLTVEINQRNFSESTTYGFHGRAVGSAQKDGTTLRFTPVQVQNLYPPAATLNPLQAPVAFPRSPATTTYVDANGNITVTTLDQSGQTRTSSDAIGPFPSIENNSQNLPTQIRDARGHVTRFEYDSRGNVVRTQDSLSGLGGAAAVYEFDGTLNGVVGPALVAIGQGQFENDSVFGVDRPVYVFPQRSGLVLDTTGLIPTDNYSLELVMSFDETSSYRKIADFENLTLDSGFYQRSGLLNFYPVTDGGTFQAGVYQHIVLTRSAADQRVVAYVNGLQAFAITDDQSRADIQNADDLLTFFVDDVATGGNESSAGRVARLRVYGEPLSPEEVAERAREPFAGGGVGRGERTFAYDAAFSQLTQVVDELGHETLLEIDPVNGDLRSITRVVGIVGGDDDLKVQFTYTSQRLPATLTDPNGHVTQFDYDTLGRLITTTFAVGTADQAVRRLKYDSAGNVIAAVDENGNRTVYAYDALDRLVQMTEADPDGSGPLASPITVLTYDEVGNLLSVTDGGGNVTRYAYDAMNRRIQATDPLNAISTLEYDAAGNLVTVTDPLGHKTNYQYDGRNRLVEATDPSRGRTRYTYDLSDNLITLTDPSGNATSFGYDARDRMIVETDPLGKARRYSYDAVNNLIALTDRNDRQTEFIYDELNRLSEETWTGGENVVRYNYDRADNLLSIADTFSALTYTYDHRDRVKTVVNAGTPGAPNVILTLNYDALGNVVSMSDTINGEAAAVTGYEYDALNRMKRVIQTGDSSTSQLVDFTYNSLGQFDSIVRYSDLTGTSSVASSAFSYDNFNRLTSLTHRNTTTIIADYQYAYDSASRITQITDKDGITDYRYDERDQLTGAQHSNLALPDETYSYDATGNRVSSSLHGNDYATGGGNRLASDGKFNYEYDEEGNLIRRVELATGITRKLQWDYRNRMVAVIDEDAGGTKTQEIRYSYDALNRRISQAVDSNPTDSVDAVLTHFIYGGDDILLEFLDADGINGPDVPVQTFRYLHGPSVDQVLAQEDGEGNVSWLLADRLGTVRDQVDNSGALQNHITYDSFGNVISESNSAVTPRYLFTGREFDNEVDWYYYRARYYDASIGRFLSEDPLGFGASDVNLSRYVHNDPVRQKDPFGLDVWLEGPSGLEPAGHLSVSVGDPNGSYSSYSFGTDFSIGWFTFRPGLVGTVYVDQSSGGQIVVDTFRKTTKQEDEQALNLLRSLKGQKAHYGVIDGSCRDFSYAIYNNFLVNLGSSAAPPNDKINRSNTTLRIGVSSSSTSTASSAAASGAIPIGTPGAVVRIISTTTAPSTSQTSNSTR